MVANQPSIAVLGCGPAAVISAIGLARLGHQVEVIGKLRRGHVCEGISFRVAQALHHFGLTNSVQLLNQPVPRSVTWNGQTNAANQEYLINRQRFDQALLKDLQDSNIALHPKWIKSLRKQNNQWEVSTNSGDTRFYDYVVEARGRSAPLKPQSQTRSLLSPARIRGPETLAIGQHWQSDDPQFLQPFTHACSFKTGWLWLACEGDGALYTQLILSVSGEGKLPNKQKLATLLDEMLDQLDITRTLRDKGRPVGQIQARSSTSILAERIYDNRLIRVGDAAMAIDPLSGNGIFQSISSALILPAVLNTLIHRPDNALCALDFYHKRIEHLFYRFCRTGRDFYQMEQGFEDSKFWQQRRSWPDAEAVHPEQDKIIGKAIRPVVNHGFIEKKPVVITANQPLGVWKYGNMDAVNFLNTERESLLLNTKRTNTID